MPLGIGLCGRVLADLFPECRIFRFQGVDMPEQQGVVLLLVNHQCYGRDDDRRQCDHGHAESKRKPVTESKHTEFNYCYCPGTQCTAITGQSEISRSRASGVAAAVPVREKYA
jgi:hypothetical protein